MQPTIPEGFVLNAQTLPLMAAMLDDMPGGFFAYRSTGGEELIYFNRAMLRIFGCETEEEFRTLTQNSFRGIVHPDDYDSVNASIHEQIAGNPEALDYVEYRIVRKDGSVRWVQDYGRYLPETGFGSLFYVFIEDATDRVLQRMEELERINAELKSIHAREFQYQNAILHNAMTFFEVDLTTDAFISTAARLPDGGIADMFDFIGVPHFSRYSEFITDWVSHMEPTEAARFRHFFDPVRLMESYGKGKPEQVFESTWEGPDGRRRILQMAFLIGRNENNGHIIALSIAKDITEQSERKRLFQMVLEEANAANVARQTFLSNISHDIRTPLNSIIGYTDLIAANAADEEKLLHYLGRIRESSRDLLDIINDALEITHMESGKAMLTRAPFDLSALLHDTEMQMLPDAERKQIAFLIDTAGVRNFGIISDETRLGEVLRQLLDNAIKYTQPGGTVALRVTEAQESPAGFGCYAFTVQDNGLGIAEDFVGRIFEPFQREANTTHSGIHGAGLGLAVVKNIVDMMEGRIEVESTKGAGTKVTVTFTFLLQQHQPQHLPEGEFTFDRSALQGLRILLAEDNEINQEIEKEMLESVGCIVDTAMDGAEAVKQVEALPPGVLYDIVLMDIQMPVMNGYEAARAIRKLPDPAKASIPIVALSANTFEEDRRRSYESGMDAYFTKPVDTEGLQSYIARVLHL